MNNNYKEFALANISKVEITSKAGEFVLEDVFSEAKCLAYVSEGEEKSLRVKNTIKATNSTEDLILGYDLEFLGSTVVPELLALVDGGKWDKEKEEYTSPAIGKPVKREIFDMKIWTENKDCDGLVDSYMVFEFLNCKGTPLNYEFADGDFYIPEMKIKSRPNCGENPVKFSIVNIEEDSLE